MKISFALILSIVIAVGLVAFGFTYFQISSEKGKLRSELEIRTAFIASETFHNNKINYKKMQDKGIFQFYDSLTRKYKLKGFAIYYSADSIISNQESSVYLKNSLDFISQVLSSESTHGNYFTYQGEDIYQYITVISDEESSRNVGVLYADAEYINTIISRIWLQNFIRWFIQALLVSLVTLGIIRWGIFSPINKIVGWVKASRNGDIEHFKQEAPAKFLVPLYNEIVRIAKAMHEAKASAEEEAKLRTNSEAIWTPERLKVEVGNLLQNKKMIVVSNREPYMHIHEGNDIKCIVPASGMITAMEPILKACGGLWIASGSTRADKETADENGKIMVPPEEPRYTLKRLFLTEEEESHFYYGFSNEGLWPLCHIAHTRPVFRIEDWTFYKKVNENFAKAILEETRNQEDPFVLIQDYHFALLPELIKRDKPKARVVIFWHIPWPNPESFGICPWQKEILQGMLGSDIIGFHTQYHCNHFLETVNKTLESRVLWDSFSVKMGGHTTLVKPFPISIAFTLNDYDNREVPPDRELVLGKYGVYAKHIGVGVDRLDYTKGILEKFLAIERFLEKNPHYVGKFTFIQIAAPTRTLIKSYAEIEMAVEAESNRINSMYKVKNWKPILLLKSHHSHKEIAPLYAIADFCMVTSLHDGMNLVAKEFVASRNKNDGTLILSRFAGASQELKGALIINPYDTEASAEAIKTALEMSKENQYERMKQMRRLVVRHNIYSWAATLLRTMANINL